MLTFVEFMITMPKNNYILIGVSQKIGDGDNAEYEEVLTADVDYDFGAGDVNDKSARNLWDCIVLFFEELIQKIEIFFLGVFYKE